LAWQRTTDNRFSLVFSCLSDFFLAFFLLPLAPPCRRGQKQQRQQRQQQQQQQLDSETDRSGEKTTEIFTHHQAFSLRNFEALVIGNAFRKRDGNKLLMLQMH